MTTLVVVAVAVLTIPALSAPVAAAESVILECTTTLGVPSLGLPNVIECDGEIPLGEGHLRCESPGVITALGGVFMVAPASCTASGSSPLGTGQGELTADVLTINTVTGTALIMNGIADLTLTQPQTGSSLNMACDGAMVALTAVPPALNTPLGTCEGDATLNLPGGTTAQATMVCSGSAIATGTPFALHVPSGTCEGEMTVTGVGAVRISADNPTVALTTAPVPVLTVTGPNLTVEVTLVGGLTEEVQCSSAMILDFSQVPLLTIPQTLCTTT